MPLYLWGVADGSHHIPSEVGTRLDGPGFAEQVMKRIVFGEWFHDKGINPEAPEKLRRFRNLPQDVILARLVAVVLKVSNGDLAFTEDVLHGSMVCRFLLFLCAALLVACESRDFNEFSLKEIEGDEGEAVVRYMIKTIPDPAPGVPKVYTVVKGDHLFSTKMDFVRRMEDLKLTFVSGEVLTTLKDEDRSIVDPRSGLSPIIIQVAKIHRDGINQWDVETGWAYKKIYERHKLKLVKKEDGTFEVTADERLEGNYLPPLNEEPSAAAKE